MRRRLASLLALGWALGAGTSSAGAQSISVSGNPAPLAITTAVPGSQPTSVSGTTSTYTVTAGLLGTYKITARLTGALPAGVTLRITLAAPSGATSAGAVTLTTSPQDVVTNISALTSATRNITYELQATVGAGVLPSTTRDVVLEIVRVS